MITGGSSGAGLLSGTLAAKPAASAATKQGYWATDTDEIYFSDGATWHQIRSLTIASGGIALANGGGFTNGGSGAITLNNNGLFVNGSGSTGGVVNNSNANWEATTATAGSGAAPPSTVQGYFVLADHGGTQRKVPYYAT